MLGSLRGFGGSIAQILVLSLLLQLHILVSPFFMQLVVDDAMAKDDQSLLVALALGFGLLVLFNAGAAALRALVLQYLQSAISLNIGVGLFRHLIRLPLANGRTLTIKDLDRQPLVMYAPIESRYHYDLVSSVFQAAGITPTFVQYAREIHTMLALVGAGVGVALVPRIAGNLGFVGVELQEIAFKPQVLSELTFVWRQRSGNPALRAFTGGLLQQFVAEL